MAKYWKANKALSAKIDELFEASSEMARKSHVIAKRLGAKGLYYGNCFGCRVLTGFMFSKSPDPKVFRKLRDTKDGWAPRRNKANNELHSEMDQLRDNFANQVANLIKAETMIGLTYSTPGVTMVKGVAYIKTHDGVKSAKDCTRITDLAYERATKTPDKSKARRKVAQ